MQFLPSREDFHAHAASHTIVPVWTSLLADLETPVAAYIKLVGDGPGFLLESVEGAERWARFSFVGRNPTATIVSRNGVVELDGTLPDGIPTGDGILAALESLLSIHTSPTFDDLPPLHGGIMGYLGYDVIREVEHLPDVPNDDRSYPDAVMSVIGSLAAFDHWRQRVYLIESVPTLGLSTEQLDAAYDAAVERVTQAVADLAEAARLHPGGAAVAGRRATRAPCRRCRAGCTSRRSRWPRSTSWPATSSRSCSPSGTTSISTPIRSTCTGCCARSTRRRTCTSCAIRS